MYNIFKGLITALITPFNNNKLDLESLEKLLERQINAKVDGIIIAGSTGEGTSLEFEEYKLLIPASKEILKQNIPLVVGCSSNNTAYATLLAKTATDMKVDGFMCCIPSYVKPTQEGIFKHFEAVHDASNLPIMLYSVPSRTTVDFSDETIVRLSKLPRIIALKDAGNDLVRPLRLKALIKEDFNLLTGNDDLSVAYNAHGGVGCVSVASNIAPKLCKKLQDEWTKGNVSGALQIHEQLLPLYQALFIESNPIPVKYALHHLGLCTLDIRLPLTKASFETSRQIQEALGHCEERIRRGNLMKFEEDCHVETNVSPRNDELINQSQKTQL